MSQPDDNGDASRQHNYNQVTAETDPLIPSTNTTGTKSAAAGTQRNVVLVFLGLQIALFAAALE